MGYSTWAYGTLGSPSQAHSAYFVHSLQSFLYIPRKFSPKLKEGGVNSCLGMGVQGSAQGTQCRLGTEMPCLKVPQLHQGHKFPHSHNQEERGEGRVYQPRASELTLPTKSSCTTMWDVWFSPMVSHSSPGPPANTRLSLEVHEYSTQWGPEGPEPFRGLRSNCRVS